MVDKTFRLSIFLSLFIFAGSVHAEAIGARDTIYYFYKSYFSNLNAGANAKINPVELVYSKSFAREISRNKELCKRFPDEICGWGADGDIYLDAQDYGDNLNFANSRLKVSESPGGFVHVSFVLFPSDKQVQDGERHISYKMIFESNKWVVDNILYGKNASARNQIKSENALIIEDLKRQNTKTVRDKK
jgi:hypothetical protein